MDPALAVVVGVVGVVLVLLGFAAFFRLIAGGWQIMREGEQRVRAAAAEDRRVALLPPDERRALDEESYRRFAAEAPLPALFAAAYVENDARQSLRSAKVEVERAWAAMQVQLQRRHDLIGRLEGSLQTGIAFEHQALVDVTRARSDAGLALGRDVAETARLEASLTGALSRLRLVVEGYPTLRSFDAIMYLLTQISRIEDDLAIARDAYNNAVGEYNRTLVASFPSPFSPPSDLQPLPYFTMS